MPVRTRKGDRGPKRRTFGVDVSFPMGPKKKGMRVSFPMGPRPSAWSRQPSVNTGIDEERRWVLFDIDPITHASTPKEEITIEDNPESSTHPYEIVTHDFISGDIETEDDARTLAEAQRRVKKILKENPDGLYRR